MGRSENVTDDVTLVGGREDVDGDEARIIGSGVSFPFRFDAHGRVSAHEYGSGYDKIRNSVLLIVLMNVGSRFMRPSFGSRLGEKVFDTFSSDVIDSARLYILEALRRDEPRIRVSMEDIVIVPMGSVSSVVGGDRENELSDAVARIDISYELAGIGRRDTVSLAV